MMRTSAKARSTFLAIGSRVPPTSLPVFGIAVAASLALWTESESTWWFALGMTASLAVVGSP